MKRLETGEIEISKIKIGANVRKSLNQEAVDSIAKTIPTHGIINPIEIDQNNRLITGAQRVAACMKVGKTKIRYTRYELTEDEFMERQLIENLSRSDITLTECLPYLKELRKKYKTTRELAGVLGRSHSWIGSVLDFDSAPTELKQAVKSQKMHPSVAIRINRAHIPESAKKRVIKEAIREDHGRAKIDRTLTFERTKERVRNIVDLDADEKKKTTDDYVGEVLDKIIELNKWLNEQFLVSGKLSSRQEERIKSALKDLKKRVDYWLS